MRHDANEQFAYFLNSLEDSLIDLMEFLSSSAELFDEAFNMCHNKVNYTVLFIVTSCCIFVICMLNSYYQLNDGVGTRCRSRQVSSESDHEESS